MAATNLTRRGLLLGAAALASAPAAEAADEDVVGQPLCPWRRGGLACKPYSKRRVMVKSTRLLCWRLTGWPARQLSF